VLPLVAQTVKLARRVDPAGDASVTTHSGVTRRDDDLAVSDRPDRDLVTGSESGFAHHPNWKRHLVLGGDARHDLYGTNRRSGGDGQCGERENQGGPRSVWRVKAQREPRRSPAAIRELRSQRRWRCKAAARSPTRWRRSADRPPDSRAPCGQRSTALGRVIGELAVRDGDGPATASALSRDANS
jgi:hypothetical protein